jgi:hypothetical protein
MITAASSSELHHQRRRRLDHAIDLRDILMVEGSQGFWLRVRRRVNRSGSAAKRSGRTLMATSRSNLVSCAR